MSPITHLRRRTRLIVASALVVPLLAACGSDGSSASKKSSEVSSSSTPDHDMSDMSGHDMTASGEHVVTIKLLAYKPGAIEIPAGTTVTWAQQDPGTHTVTSGTVETGATATTRPDGTFDSGELARGERFSQEFDEPGTYSYFCRIHPATMRGRITVR